MKHQLIPAILALFLLTAGAAFGAEVSIGAGSVDFSAAGSGVLTVSGPEGYEHRQAIDGAASLSLYDEAGQPLADGTYTWQVTLDGVAPEERSERAIEGESASGTFSVAGGSAVDPNALEGGSAKAQVINDDLIVDGSACVGIDCTSNETFGFDTLRLKENNLRIKFDDTSGSASFPNNDWQLTANDSTNGGANRFSIDDVTHGKTPFTVQANAPNNALILEGSTGDVGLGTATPAVELHVVDGDSPTLRLEQDGSSGFTQQTWDVAGNETNFFVRDVTGGSKLPFRIKPGARDDALFIDADGDIGLGTDSPDADLEIVSSESFAFFRLTATGADPNSAVDLTFTDGGAEGAFRINIVDGDSQELEIDAAGNLTLQGSCIQLGDTACTASAGTLSCVAGTC